MCGVYDVYILYVEIAESTNVCNVDFIPRHYPNPGESKHVMPNDFETIKLVRANHGAHAIFFKIFLKLCSMS